ncbi:MAG: hypothetical protein AB1480_10940, partial [Nitrospirota bacterium]
LSRRKSCSTIGNETLRSFTRLSNAMIHDAILFVYRKIRCSTKQEMLKTVEIEMSKLPYLFYGDKKELEDKDIKPVTI